MRGAFAAVVCFAATGCGGASAPAAEVAAPAAPPPRNCDVLAQAAVGGRAGALVYVDRVRESKLAPRIGDLAVWGPIFDGTGVDPQRDLDRLYVTTLDVRHGDQSAAVAEHALPEDRVKAAVEAMIGKSDPPGAWVDGLGAPAARVTVRGHERLVALPTPHLLVVLPPDAGAIVARFAKSGGCPDPKGDEAARGTSTAPGEVLAAPRVPPIPPTIDHGEAVLRLLDDGGLRLAIDAVSASPEQAALDADEMTRSVDAATSLKVGFVTLRMFPQTRFHHEDDHVKGELYLSADEVDRLLGLARTFIPR